MTGKLIQLRPDARVDRNSASPFGEAARPGRAGPFESLSDEGLVAACATSDRVARSLLFERHADAVYRFIARMRGSDADTVDDLVQATFMSAYQSAGRYRGGHVRGWLYGIAANQVRMYARKEIRRKTALHAVAQTVDTTKPVRDAALLARLPEAIAALPHDERVALVLVDLEGEKGCDAAAALGVPEGTLWRRLFHARKRLRAALGGES